MGDIRNKLAKQMRDAAHRAFMAERYPPQPAPAPPRCQCGLTADQVPTFWSYKGEHFDPMRYYCPACAPVWMVRYMLASTVNNPASYLEDDMPGRAC